MLLVACSFSMLLVACPFFFCMPVSSIRLYLHPSSILPTRHAGTSKQTKCCITFHSVAHLRFLVYLLFLTSHAVIVCAIRLFLVSSTCFLLRVPSRCFLLLVSSFFCMLVPSICFLLLFPSLCFLLLVPSFSCMPGSSISLYLHPASILPTRHAGTCKHTKCCITFHSVAHLRFFLHLSPLASQAVLLSSIFLYACFFNMLLVACSLFLLYACSCIRDLMLRNNSYSSIPSSFAHNMSVT
jgi:hypothetical protein